MKHLLLTTIAAVMLVGCGELQQSTLPAEAKPKPPTAKAPDISIHDAAKTGNIEAVKQHLAAGTDVNAKGMMGLTPLHEAARYGHKGVVELFIAEGADVNAKNGAGVTTLSFAVFRGHRKIASLLRKHGAKTAEELDISIHDAAFVGNIKAVKQHLAAGTDVNGKNDFFSTPLHYATWQGHKENAELLIAKGADVEAKDDNWSTPLHKAAKFGRKEVAELLISNSADINAKNFDSETPLDLAEKVEVWHNIQMQQDRSSSKIKTAKKETADLLRKHGGKTGEELKAEGK